METLPLSAGLHPATPAFVLASYIRIKSFSDEKVEIYDFLLKIATCQASPKKVPFHMAHKDTMFRSLFNNEKSLLELYTPYTARTTTKDTEIIINTLDETLVQ